MANFDINVSIIAREKRFHPCKIETFTTQAGHHTMSYGARPGIGRCNHIQTPVGARTICDYARENY